MYPPVIGVSRCARKDPSVSPLASGASSIPMVWYSDDCDPHTGTDVGDSLPWVGRVPEHDATTESQQNTARLSSQSRCIDRQRWLSSSNGVEHFPHETATALPLPSLRRKPVKLVKPRPRGGHARRGPGDICFCPWKVTKVRCIDLRMRSWGRNRGEADG